MDGESHIPDHPCNLLMPQGEGIISAWEKRNFLRLLKREFLILKQIISDETIQVIQ